jgi:hypothetical protein
MKFKITILLMLMTWLTGVGPITGVTASESDKNLSPVVEKQPIAVLSENQYQFAPVLEGTRVRHTFVLKNTGTAPLEIQRVRTG